MSPCAAAFVSVFNGPPWSEQWTKERALAHLQDGLEAPGALGLVARDGVRVVGFVLGHRKMRDLSVSFYIQEMCILEAYRGQGVGRQIVAALEAKLAEQSISSLYLLTARNSAAEAFYEKLGFYNNEGVVVMTKRLS